MTRINYKLGAAKMRDSGIILKESRECKNVKANIKIFRSVHKTRESCPTL
jgi:hypothetical protein